MEIGGIIVIWHIIKAVLVAIFCAARVVAPINGYINVTISDTNLTNFLYIAFLLQQSRHFARIALIGVSRFSSIDTV